MGDMGVMEMSGVGVAVVKCGLCYLECLGISRVGGVCLGDVVPELVRFLECLD